MNRKQLSKPQQQRGISITGLIVALAVLGVVGIFALRLIPAYVEYNAIKKAIGQAKQTGGTVRDMQAAFDRNADINSVEAITGRDLVITRDGEQTEISFAYEKRLPLAGNVNLLIDFAGTTDPSGTVATADDTQAAR
jgi:type II secretory pathway pseudopilin PulG